MLPSYLSDLYRPVILVHSSTDVDTIIRTHYDKKTNYNALHDTDHIDGIISLLQSRAKSLRFFKPAAIRPPVWSHAISRLEDALTAQAAVAQQLVDTFQAALHASTLGTPHDFLNRPLLRISVYWVGQDIVDYSASDGDSNGHPLGASLASTNSSANNAEHHIILVMRNGKKQDEAAYENALKSSHNLIDNLKCIHTLVLDEEKNINIPRPPNTTGSVTSRDEFVQASPPAPDAHGAATSIEAVCKALILAVKNHLSKHVSILSEQHARLRRARGSTFSQWLRGTPIVEPSLNTDSLDSRTISTSTTPANSAPNSPLDTIDPSALSLPMPPPALPKKRRISFAGDCDDTPLFPADSYESCARNHADYLLLQGSISDAFEIYRALATDFKALTGPARLHEAAAHEMIGIATTLVSNTTSANAEIITRSTETAIAAYAAADRPELAIRVALRLPAVNALMKTVIVLRNERIPGSFLDMATAILHTKTALELIGAKKQRKASLDAFLAVTKFTKISMRRPAAIAIKLVHPTALKWKGIQDEVDIVCGMAELDHAGSRISENNNSNNNNTTKALEHQLQNTARNAVTHFINVLANSDEHADVEVQSFIVRQLANAVKKGAVEIMKKSWKDGAKFPKIVPEMTTIDTLKIGADANGNNNGNNITGDNGDDSNNKRAMEIRKGEDEVLYDFEYFEQVRTCMREKKDLPVREKKLSDVIQEMRNSKDDLGGSLENKIRRMKERDANVRKRRRGSKSLLDGCAVVGEVIDVTIALRNPLHFPVFVNDMCAVVTLDGQLYYYYSHNNTNNSNNIEFLQHEEVVLGPRSVENITLKIVAHRTGILRCIGATWKFTIGMGDSNTKERSQIPGTAVVERRGKRLNATQKQRASKYPMYAVDESLQVEVTHPTPRISITGAIANNNNNNSITWKAGEMRKIQLTLHNHGSVECQGITFRIHTPDTVRLETIIPSSAHSNGIVDHGDGDNNNTNTNNTPLTYKENGDAIISGYLPVVIAPGKSAPLWIWIRACGDLKPQKNNNNNNNSKSSKPPADNKDKHNISNRIQTVSCFCALSIAYGKERARVARWEAKLHVEPSIYISRRFLVPHNSNSNNKGFLLGVEVEHSAHGGAEKKIIVPCYNVEWLSNTSRNGWVLHQLPDTQSPGHNSNMEKKNNNSSKKLINIDTTTTAANNNNNESISNKMDALRVNETATLFAVLHKEEYDDGHNSNNNKKDWKTNTVTFDKKEDAHHDNDNECAEFRSAVQHYVLTAENNRRGKYAKVREKGALIAVVWNNPNGDRGALFLSPIDVERYALVALDANGNNNGSRASSTINTRSSSFTSLPTTPRAPISADALAQKMQNMHIIDAENGGQQEEEDSSSIVKLSLRHPEFASADFSAHGLACVPVDLFVRNVSNKLVDVFVTAASHDGIADGARGRYWTGDTSMSLRAIPPQAERFLQLTAVIDSPGIYNMAHINVKYQLKNNNNNNTNNNSNTAKVGVNLENSFVNVVHKASSGNLPELDDLVAMSSGELEDTTTSRSNTATMQQEKDKTVEAILL